MNKLKLLYDVVRTMKDKELFKGTLKVEGRKDQVRIFGFDNEFEKNASSGQSKTKMSSEIDYEGKKVKHESKVESNTGCFQGHMHRHFMEYGHFEHGHHGHFGGFDNRCENTDHGGIKDKLAGILFLLNALNNIKVDEKEDGSCELSLNAADIPEELKKAIRERTGGRAAFDQHNHHEFLKELHSMENPDFDLNILLSKGNEVEKITVAVKGQQKDEDNNTHEMDIRAELCLAW